MRHSNQSQPRNIDISKARTQSKKTSTPTSKPQQRTQRPATVAPVVPVARRAPQRVSPLEGTVASRVARPAETKDEALARLAHNHVAHKQRVQQKKRKRKSKSPFARIALVLLLLVGAVACGGYFAVQGVGNAIVNEGTQGSLDSVSQPVELPPEYAKSNLNLLVLGIDYSTDDAVERDPIGNTDMILYAQFDFKANTLEMLQIPRDTFVGEVGGSSGKINGVYRSATDTNNRVAAVAQVIANNLKLPVDNYVTIDMESLTEIVNLFGGIEIEIPYDMIDHDDVTGKVTSALYAGTRNLMGKELEFFLRARDILPRGDLDRLENQRNFYKALFKRLLTATVPDLVKLIPVGAKYVNSDLSVNDLIGIAINVLKIESHNIMMCTLPAYDSPQKYNKNDVIVNARQESADLLNQYFRTPETQVTVDGIVFPDYPQGTGLYPPNTMWFGEKPVEAEPVVPDPTTSDSTASQNTQPAVSPAA